MSHDISWKSDGPRTFLRDRVDQLERTVEQLLAVYTRDTNISREQAQRLFFTDLADHYFNAKEALEMGFVSSIITPESSLLRGSARPAMPAVEVAAVEPPAVASEQIAAINFSQD
jgi:ATP-dependent protease ClpP protease subunit